MMKNQLFPKYLKINFIMLRPLRKFIDLKNVYIHKVDIIERY